MAAGTFTGAGAASVTLCLASVALSAAAFVITAFASAIAFGASAFASSYAFVVIDVGHMPPIMPFLACVMRAATLTGGGCRCRLPRRSRAQAGP